MVGAGYYGMTAGDDVSFTVLFSFLFNECGFLYAYTCIVEFGKGLIQRLIKRDWIQLKHFLLSVPVAR